jgi:hypothetical protein
LALSLTFRGDGKRFVVHADGRKQASASFPTEAFVLSAFYLLWDVRNSATSVELLIFVMNHGSGPTLVVTCS